MISELIGEKTEITDITTGIVASRPKQMYGWPGIVKISENEILVSASERRYHCCPYGREVIIRSLDGGQSWGLPQEVYNSELDDRDANLAITPDGTLILGWFTIATVAGRWKERISRITKKMRNDLVGSWMCISKDKGHSWEKAQKMPTGAHISPIVLSDGSIITIGEKLRNEEPFIAVYKSKDLGQTWKKAGEIQCRKLWHEQYGRNRLMLNENHVLETSPGKLIVMFRSNPLGDGYLFQSSSEDNGATWSNPHKIDVWGYPPHLLRLSNGAIMCAYGYRRKPYSIRAVFSYDEGKNWDTDKIVSLYEWEDEPDIGYPVSVEITPGNILTVFYCSRRDQNHATSSNLPEGIMSVKFKISSKV